MQRGITEKRREDFSKIFPVFKNLLQGNKENVEFSTKIPKSFNVVTPLYFLIPPIWEILGGEIRNQLSIIM